MTIRILFVCYINHIVDLLNATHNIPINPITKHTNRKLSYVVLFAVVSPRLRDQFICISRQHVYKKNSAYERAKITESVVTLYNANISDIFSAKLAKLINGHAFNRPASGPRKAHP